MTNKFTERVSDALIEVEEAVDQTNDTGAPLTAEERHREMTYRLLGVVIVRLEDVLDALCEGLSSVARAVRDQ